MSVTVVPPPASWRSEDSEGDSDSNTGSSDATEEAFMRQFAHINMHIARLATAEPQALQGLLGASTLSGTYAGRLSRSQRPSYPRASAAPRTVPPESSLARVRATIVVGEDSAYEAQNFVDSDLLALLP
mmetsp:Transcript_13017/g.47577  ORF Transcript_13017/g.47577 Transcript_13017/m.47577 type:complete len:129 (+) Transcript_13017:2148-2534(+)